MSGYVCDPFCQSVRSALPLRDDCAEVDGLLFIDNRLLIPSDLALRHREGHKKTVSDFDLDESVHLGLPMD
ncbi:hypothetical protein PSTG_20122, partial [Puccinia striiformis f. sp. tritici PST-78]